LLCDNCNWEFVGFAVPGTVSAKPTKNPKKKQINKSIETLDDHASNNSTNGLKKETSENLIAFENLAGQSVKAKKKVKPKTGV
jgi:hypothetical protein